MWTLCGLENQVTILGLYEMRFLLMLCDTFKESVAFDL